MRLVFSAFAILLLIAPGFAQSDPIAADAGFFRTPIETCETDLKYFNQVTGWQVTWPREWERIAAAAPDGVEEAVARWAAAPEALAEARKSLKEGLWSNRAAPRAVVLRVHQQVQDLIVSIEARDARYFADDSNGAAWNEHLESVILPALRNYAKFLGDEYLAGARLEPGLLHIEDGVKCFEDAALWWTTLDLASDEIEAIGTRVLHETRAELLAAYEDTTSFEEIVRTLRAQQGTDKTTADELMQISRAAIDRAQDAMLSTFAKAGDAAFEVVEMPPHLRDSAPAGFYRRPEEGVPAAYIINTSRPGERRLMAEVIAFHEGAPGHHLFLTYPRDSDIEGYNAGLLEGWAIYAEYLADEMDLYSTHNDRVGMIAKHLWAASRLIVEPGLHLRGWSREDAIEFMYENTVLSRAEIETEVDRYLALPGQSLSYMLGADFILSERARARSAMGDAFDIKAFHDVILRSDVRPLPEVRRDIRAWVAETGN